MVFNFIIVLYYMWFYSSLVERVFCCSIGIVRYIVIFYWYLNMDKDIDILKKKIFVWI